MERLALLSNESQPGDQALETDMMRFMAIIGIVFWIVFALIKTIPYQASETDTRISSPIPAKKLKPERTPAQNSFQSAIETHSDSNLKNVKPKPRQQQPNPNPPKNREQTSPELTAMQIQFESLEDLLDLITSQKVKLFCQAQDKEFDLIFVAYAQGNSISFKGTHSLPTKLWEIKSGKDYTYFLYRIDRMQPAIRNFPTKRVLVSFTDTSLESRFEQELRRLEHQGQNGVLSITRTGNVNFQEFNLKQPVSDQLEKQKN